MKALIVDDDETFRVMMQRRLAASGHQVESAASGEAALERLAARAFDVVLLDLRMPGLGGLETLKRIREAHLPCEVVVLTGQPDFEDCVTAMKSGAFHYLCKPTEPALIEDTLGLAVEHLRLRRENAAFRRMLRPAAGSDFVGDSAAIRAVLRMTEQIAPTDGRVVILGESGTGKGLLARTIHALSRRRNKPFIDVHCGAVADQLLESELFGHERGAFTGAVGEKPGLFELADGGTLFLDEFAEMTAEMQTKLLKVLDSGELRRVGGVRTMTVDLRVLVATNRNVDELVRTGRLREDLLHRVDVIRIVLPPLRERPNDVPRFIHHFMEAHRRRGLSAKTLTPEAMRTLQAYRWPGNVRELANTIERLMILTPQPTIDVGDLPDNLRAGEAALTVDDLSLTLDEVERRHVQRILQSSGGQPGRSSEMARGASRHAQPEAQAVGQRPDTTGNGMSTVQTDRDGSVVIITINRPDVRNAVNTATAEALTSAVQAYEHDDGLSVAVLTGAGGNFCAGYDLKAVARGERRNMDDPILAPMGPTRLLLNKPLIAAVEGHAVAGGLELAIWCDLRVAAQDAVFGVYNRRFGVPLLDLGTIRLPRLIGHSHAMDLILSGRGVQGEEALRIGLVNRLVPHGTALEAAVALAHEIARFPQQCIRSDRLSAYEQWSLSYEDAWRNELRRGRDVLASGEPYTGAAAFARGQGRHGARP